MTETLIKKTEYCAMLGIPKSTFFDHLKRGLLPCQNHSRNYVKVLSTAAQSKPTTKP